MPRSRTSTGPCLADRCPERRSELPTRHAGQHVRYLPLGRPRRKARRHVDAIVRRKKAMNRLEEKFRSAKFVVTTELTPPKGIDLSEFFAKADALKSFV